MPLYPPPHPGPYTGQELLGLLNGGSDRALADASLSPSLRWGARELAYLGGAAALSWASPGSVSLLGSDLTGIGGLSSGGYFSLGGGRITAYDSQYLWLQSDYMTLQGSSYFYGAGLYVYTDAMTVTCPWQQVTFTAPSVSINDFVFDYYSLDTGGRAIRSGGQEVVSGTSGMYWLARDASALSFFGETPKGPYMYQPDVANGVTPAFAANWPDEAQVIATLIEAVNALLALVRGFGLMQASGMP